MSSTQASGVRPDVKEKVPEPGLMGIGTDGVMRGRTSTYEKHLGDLGVDLLAGLGAGGQGDDPATGVMLGQDATRHGPAAVADAGEDDLRDVPGHGRAPSVVSGNQRRAQRLT